MSSGAEPDVDRDLAMLTYEIAALVGMGGPTAFDAMAALASERMSSPSDPPRLAATPRIDLAGCSWTGSYAAVDGGPHRSMGLDVDFVDGLAFEGAGHWPNVTTSIRGRLQSVPVAREDRAVWAQVSSLATRPLCALRSPTARSRVPARLS
jgi:hypothetical protein